MGKRQKKNKTKRPKQPEVDPDVAVEGLDNLDPSQLPPLDDICPAEYLRALPDGLTRVTVEIREIHALLLELTNVTQVEYDQAVRQDHQRRSQLEEISRSLDQSQLLAEGEDGEDGDLQSDEEQSEDIDDSEQFETDSIDEDESDTPLCRSLKQLRQHQKALRIPPALEADIMAQLPSSIATKVYQQLDADCCTCPAGCSGFFHTDDFEQHCLAHLRADREQERIRAENENKKSTEPQSNAASSPSTNSSSPSGTKGFIADLSDEVLLDEPEDHDDVISSLIDDGVPVPDLAHDDSHIRLFIPEADFQEEQDSDLGGIDEPLDNVLDWLYYDAEQAAVARWNNFYSALKNVNKRISALTPLIEAKEQVLGIRGQVAQDFQKRLMTMAPTSNPEDQRIRAHMVEILCLNAVIDNYVEITRRRINVFEKDLDSVSALAKRMQDSISDISKQVDGHVREIQQLEVQEVRTLKEEFELRSLSARSRRRAMMKSLDSESYRQQKDDLAKKVDLCRRRIVTLKEKYARTLRILVRTREKLSAQQEMESALAHLQNQCNRIVETNPENSGEDSQDWLGISGISEKDLHAIIAFEKQESDDLERLLSERDAKIKEQRQLLQLMKEISYCDPLIKIVKDAFIHKIEQMANEARVRQARLKLLAKQNKEQQRRAALEALLKEEEEERKKRQHKEEQRRLAEQQRQAEKLQREEAARKKKLEAERKAQQEKEEQQRKAEAALKAKQLKLLESIRQQEEAAQAALLAQEMHNTAPEPVQVSNEGNTKVNSKARRFDTPQTPKSKPHPRGKSSQLCRDYLRGSCPRGDNCSWLHAEPSPENLPLCKDFQRGQCKRHPCAYLHVTAEEFYKLRHKANTKTSKQFLSRDVLTPPSTPVRKADHVKTPTRNVSDRIDGQATSDPEMIAQTQNKSPQVPTKASKASTPLNAETSQSVNNQTKSSPSSVPSLAQTAKQDQPPPRPTPNPSIETPSISFEISNNVPWTNDVSSCHAASDTKHSPLLPEQAIPQWSSGTGNYTMNNIQSPTSIAPIHDSYFAPGAFPNDLQGIPLHPPMQTQPILSSTTQNTSHPPFVGIKTSVYHSTAQSNENKAASFYAGDWPLLHDTNSNVWNIDETFKQSEDSWNAVLGSGISDSLPNDEQLEAQAAFLLD